MFEFALEKFGILILGIYRLRDLMEKYVTRNYKRCVLGNPLPELKLHPTDLVYGLQPFLEGVSLSHTK